MYYGLFVKMGRKFIRVDQTTGYTLETAKKVFAAQLLTLGSYGHLRLLPPVKQIVINKKDRQYAKTPW